MSTGRPGERNEVRIAEIVAALSLASDLSLGVPIEYGLQSALIAARLAELLGVDPETAIHTYYACLLFYVGCTADAEMTAEIFGNPEAMATHGLPIRFGSRLELAVALSHALADAGSSMTVRILQSAWRFPQVAATIAGHRQASCEVAEMLTDQLGVSSAVGSMFQYSEDRWDGKGYRPQAKGSDIPLPIRIVQVARDAALQNLNGGSEHAVRVIRERAGKAFDPKIAALFADEAGDLLNFDSGRSVWEETLAAEPGVPLILDYEGIDRALRAMGNFADLVSPYLVGHSAGVAELAALAARNLGLARADQDRVERAGLVHDVGRVAVDSSLWQKPTGLSVDDWEQVRLHAYHSERVLVHSPFLNDLASVATFHHERLDGSGYHRGAVTSVLSQPRKILAAADAYHAMTEPRPHRPAQTPSRAAAILSEEAAAGRFDVDAVSAVIVAAGQTAPRLRRAAGLTERELEVVGLLARGLQTKQIAHALGISAKTADRHIQHAYGKMAVSTRAAAAMFAMQHGLTAWGELPIGRAAEHK